MRFDPRKIRRLARPRRAAVPRPTVGVAAAAAPLASILVVLFALLAIVHSPTPGMPVNLPRVSTLSFQCGWRPTITVSVTPREIYLEHWAMADLDALRKDVSRQIYRTPGPVRFKADARLRLRDVYPVLEALRDAGSSSVWLATQDVATGH